jgi:hypothetical protein
MNTYKLALASLVAGLTLVLSNPAFSANTAPMSTSTSTLKSSAQDSPNGSMSQSNLQTVTPQTTQQNTIPQSQAEPFKDPSHRDTPSDENSYNK